MRYNFDELIDRRNSNCYKWDSDHAKGTLPLWVADMDFKTAPAILKVMQRRLDHGVFGYQVVPDAYYEAISSWFSRRHGWNGISRSQIIYTIGVVPAISAVLRAMTNPGDSVMVQTPAYNCFFSSVRNLECTLINQPLLAIDNHFEIDWSDFTEKARKSKIFLLCNPHNPTGRIWTREELRKMAEICEENHVFVISDEIHCEFEFPGYKYTPYATVASTDNYCVCTAASKAFNIAGLQCANIFVPNTDNYALIDKAINIHEICDVNPFGVEALMTAYNESEEWLDQLNEYIYANYCYLRDIFAEYLPELGVTKMEGTYLAWIDCSALNMSSEQLCNELAARQQVLFNPSEMYGAEHYIRINMACPRATLEEALKRLIKFVRE